MILQLLNAAAGKDCSKDSDEIAYEAYLLMTKHSDKTHELDDSWSAWEGQPVKVVPQVETVDTLRTMQVGFWLSPPSPLCDFYNKEILSICSWVFGIRSVDRT